MDKIDYTKPARTRMAPSPTGEYHVGHIRTILFNLALSRKTGGQFIIRIEDTDTKRYVEGATDRILDIIKDYGLDWDEGPRVGGTYEPYIQSERYNSDSYKNVAMELVEKNYAYRCFCTSERLAKLREEQELHKKKIGYDKLCRYLSKDEIDENLKEGKPFTIRLKIPENAQIEMNDFLRGKITWKSNDVEDYIILKSDNIPTYHLASVVDDHEMKITHILRGQDWIPTAPVLVLLYKYLGWDIPVLIHTPNVLDPSGKGKMSKRRSGEKAFARYYLDIGYPAEAVLNYLMFLGWSHPDEKVNILSLDEFIKVFEIERLQPQDSRWDYEKIEWYGGQYIRMQSIDELFDNFVKWMDSISNEELREKSQIWKDRIGTAPEHIKKFLSLLQDRLRKYSDVFEMAEFLYSRPLISNEFDWSKTKHSTEECLGTLPGLKVELEKAVTKESDSNLNLEVDGLWTQEKWEEAVRAYADICGWKHGDMFMLLRLSIAGTPFSPNLLDSMNLIGVGESLDRISSTV